MTAFASRARSALLCACIACATLIACAPLASCTSDGSASGSASDASQSSLYSYYYSVVSSLQEEYGAGQLASDDSGDLEGLFFVELLDIDGDGVEELAVAHGDDSGYELEVYRYDASAGDAECVSDAYAGSDFAFMPITVWEQDGQMALMWGDVDLEETVAITTTRFVVDDDGALAMTVGQMVSEDGSLVCYVDDEVVESTSYAELFTLSDSDATLYYYEFMESSVSTSSSSDDEATTVRHAPEETLEAAEETIAELAAEAE